MLRELRVIEVDLRDALGALQDATGDIAHYQTSPRENLGKVAFHALKAYELANELTLQASQADRRKAG